MNITKMSISCLLLVITTSISHADGLDFQRVKTRADKNNDGRVTLNEFIEATKNDFWGDVNEARNAFLIYDIDLNNYFDEKEFLLSNDDFYIHARKAFIVYHLTYDKKPHGNEDNILEYMEMINHIKAAKPDISPDDLKQIGKSFTSLDDNQDKMLEWTEYFNYVKKINNRDR